MKRESRIIVLAYGILLVLVGCTTALSEEVHVRVLDQTNNPVPEADVEISWRYGNPFWAKTGHKSFLTDENGRVDEAFRSGVGHFVRTVTKDGYSLDLESNPIFKVPPEQQKSSKDDPIVIKIRKLGETTLLLQRNGIILCDSSRGQDTVSLDVLKNHGEDATYTDLHVSVKHRGNDTGWTVTYRVIHSSDGIVASEDLLHEAPSEGYKAEVTLLDPPWPRYLYLRTRSPQIYSRLEISYRAYRQSMTEGGLEVFYDLAVNPYGSRNLEHEPKLQEFWQLRKALEREAKASLYKSTLPVRPDLAGLIREAKEKAKKEEIRQ